MRTARKNGFFFKQSSDLRDYFIEPRFEQHTSAIDRFIISSSSYLAVNGIIVSLTMSETWQQSKITIKIARTHRVIRFSVALFGHDVSSK